MTAGALLALQHRVDDLVEQRPVVVGPLVVQVGPRTGRHRLPAPSTSDNTSRVASLSRRVVSISRRVPARHAVSTTVP